MNIKSTAVVILFTFTLLTNLLVSTNQDKEFRNWVSKDGTTKIRAEFVSFVGDKVRLRKEDGKFFNTHPSYLSLPDQAFLASLKRQKSNKQKTEKPNTFKTESSSTSVNLLKAKERKLIYAKDILKLYKDVLDKGRVPTKDLVFVENKIKKYTPLAAQDAIEFEGEFIEPAAIPARRQQGAKLVEDWLKTARTQEAKIDTKPLKDATEADPIATDAALLGGYYEYFAERNDAKARRYFNDAVRRGRKYLAINSAHDKQNLVTALNCCAVMSTKGKNFGTATKFWMDAMKVPDASIDTTIANLRRFMGLAMAGNKGISLDTSEAKKLEPFLTKFGADDSKGWRFAIPLKQDGHPYSNLKFLVRKLKEGVRVDETGFEDSVCLMCEGLGRKRCSVNACKNGVVTVKKVIIVQTPFGPMREVIQVPTRCGGCNGKAIVQCRGCSGSGTQN